MKNYNKDKNGIRCWGWLIEERVDDFVIEKYIEIGMLIQMLALTVLQYNRKKLW